MSGLSLILAERVGFEPTWGLRPQRISNPRRYDHFGTPPKLIRSVQRPFRPYPTDFIQDIPIPHPAGSAIAL